MLYMLISMLYKEIYDILRDMLYWDMWYTKRYVYIELYVILRYMLY